MGEQRKSKKVIRVSGHLPYGGDPLVDRRTGISTESHMELWQRLARGLRHGPPGAPKPRKS